MTDDTKVVERGHGDGVYITTSGIGSVPEGVEIGPHRIAPGDAILLNGDLGRHGIAVLSVRDGLSFEADLTSDCAPLGAEVASLRAAAVDRHCLRDLTRGGLGAALCELALDAGLELEIDGKNLPISDPVRGACEILGLDPLYVACEGRFVGFVSEAEQGRALAALRAAGAKPVAIGRVRGASGARPGHVELDDGFGAARLLELFYGEQLPRIC
jgi:hydrogenase expression/formation protein HypE